MGPLMKEHHRQSNVCEDVARHVIVGEQGSRGQLECQSWEGCASSLGNGGVGFVLGLRVKATPAPCSHILQTCHRPAGCGSASSASWGQTEVFVIMGAHPQGPTQHCPEGSPANA